MFGRDDRYTRAFDLARQAMSLVQQQQYETAYRLLEQAAELLAGGPGWLAPADERQRWAVAQLDVHRELGKTAYSLGRLVPARAHLEQARKESCHLTGADSTDTGVVQSLLGTVYTPLGDLDAAYDCQRDSLRIALLNDEPADSVAITLSNLGETLQLRGQRAESYDAYRRALELPGTSPVVRTGVQQNLGFHYAHHFDYPRALRVFFDALAALGRLEQSGALPCPSFERTMCLANIGQIYANQLDFERSITYQRQALEGFLAFQPDGATTANAMANLANTLQMKGETTEADRLLAGAIDIARRQRLTTPLRQYLAIRAQLARSTDPHRALRLAQEAMAVPTTGRFHDNRDLYPPLAAALAHLDLGQGAAAETLLRQALSLYPQTSGVLADLRELYAALGFAMLLNDRLDEAVDTLQKARSVSEQTRRALGEEPSVEFQFASGASVYQHLMDALYERSTRMDRPADLDEAFAVADGMRARSLARSLSALSMSDGVHDPQTRRLLVAEQQLLRRAGQARNMITAAAKADATKAELAELQQRCADLEHQAETLRLKLSSSTSDLADLIAPTAATVEQVRAVLDCGTAFVLYEPTDARTYCWVIRSHAASMVPLPVTAQQLQDLVTTVRDEAERPFDYPDLAEHLTALGGMLLEPILPLLQGVEHVAFSPGGALACLPFELLPLPHGRFTARWTSSYVPSATTLVRFGSAARSGHRPELDLVGFAPADPDLSGPQQEIAEAVHRFAPRSLAFIGPPATAEAVHAHAPRARLVHFACHAGVADQPQYSRLSLAPAPDGDPSMYAFEFARIRLHSELVIFSACSTAYGTPRAGEGLVGFYRSVLASGTDAALLTLWEVPDASSTRFMRYFHRHLSCGKTPAQALREARSAVDDGTLLSATTWAAYVLVSTSATGNRPRKDTAHG
ncbi:CHAT domain-containing tetratricopeptide repeat protein [Catellatospora sp. NPDC049111]|uniref:CHAT domain-containing tetratricopeptide repeat protein n=1 Tax=Catellatospora sp. NPDC049111 TaxID=3155271 RepID=UPI0033C28D77